LQGWSMYKHCKDFAWNVVVKTNTELGHPDFEPFAGPCGRF
jgi:hypothetical protein